MRKIAPRNSAAAPIQSPVDHVRRLALAFSLDHHANRSANTSASGIMSSSPRTSGAIADATTAPTFHHLPPERTTKAFTIRKKQSAAYGYAIVSSTRYEEYAIAGIAPAPAAANSAALRPTSMRARKYVGKTTDAMSRTSTYLIPAYAVETSWICQMTEVR